jgi:hypothetical protein
VASISRIILVLLAGNAEGATHPLSEWSQRGPDPTTLELQDMAFGDGIYAVVCEDKAGRVLVSMDGENFAFEDLALPGGELAKRIRYDHGHWLVLANGRVWRKNSWQESWTEGGPTSEPLVEIRAATDEFWAWSFGGYVGRGQTLRWANSLLYRSVDAIRWR